jgi:fatty acid desaturase
MAESSSSSSSGIGFAGALTILFVAFKLLGIINWSWVWVLSPLWISALVTVAIIVLVFSGVVTYYWVKEKLEIRANRAVRKLRNPEPKRETLRRYD